MAIKSNVGLGVIPILATDTVLVNVGALADSPTRIVVTAADIHNDGTAAATINVEVYVSPDATSAAGKRIFVLDVLDDATTDVQGIISQSFNSLQYIVAVASVVGCNAILTIGEYTDLS